VSDEVAYIECLQAQEAAYWEARRLGLGLHDKHIGDLLRAAAPHIIQQERERALAEDAERSAAQARLT
jgi:hypothetical protein